MRRHRAAESAAAGVAGIAGIGCLGIVLNLAWIAVVVFVVSWIVKAVFFD